MTGTTSENGNGTAASSKPMTPKEKAAKIWEDAPTTIEHVDNAFVFQHHQCHAFPTFDADEIKTGPRLGQGGFSNVFEITEISLKRGGSGLSGAGAGGEDGGGDGHDASYNGINKKELRAEDSKITANSHENSSSMIVQNGLEPNNKTPSNDHHDAMDENHYDVSNARSIMSKRAMRFGSARYALKRLRADLDEVEYARGALDLAIEIRYLSVLYHPNIVKMRAYSKTENRLSVDTFIVMDRLYGTLEDRIEKWAERNTMLKAGMCCGGLFGVSPQIKEAQTSLLRERLLVAYDLTVAFDYLHSLRLVYRDIKPENIGFDIRGDVKIFDFGLVKSLDDNLKSKTGYGYNLTGFTGSIPYMAPEIALKQPYDKECDVFSFSMLLWEIASLQFMYPNYSIKDYFVRVCKYNERPPVPGNGSPSWPAILKSIVQEGWSPEPKKRPPMKRIGMLLRGLLQDISNGDDSITNRTQHMMNKSRRSLHGEGIRGGGSNRGGGRRGTDGLGSSRRGNGGAVTSTNPSSTTNNPSPMVPVEALRRSRHTGRSVHDGNETMDG